MAEPANSWWDEMRQEAEASPVAPPGRPSNAMTIGGAAAAAALAVGLGWWFSTADTTTFQNRESARLQPVAAAPIALSSVDLDQVRRGRDEFDATYAVGGAEAQGRFLDSCEASARGDGRILDFCLAFDLMGDTLAPPDIETDARRLALVQAAVPAEPAPLRRVQAVRDALQAEGVSFAVPTVAAVAPRAQTPAETTPTVTVSKALPAKAEPIKVAKVRTTPPASRCATLSTPADRLVCANPSLKTQHDRMRLAYERALANGADPLAIDRGQAEWRAQRNAMKSRQDLSALYARRIAELRAAAEEARLTPPS